MDIVCIGIDYKKEDLQFRSRLSIVGSKYQALYERFLDDTEISGVIILATCNRTEFYVHFHPGKADERKVFNIVKESFKLSDQDFEKFYQLRDIHAVLHIFRVASGLESMVIGEDQILSQVKEAQSRAIDHKASDRILNKLFRDAITCAKEVKSTTHISENKLSLSSIAVDVLEEKLGGLENKKALVVGAGKMSLLAVQYLYEKNIGKIYLVNRSSHKLRNLLEKYPQLNILEFHERFTILKEIDILLSCTSAPHVLFDYDRFEKNYACKDIMAMDLAVPRDMDEKISKLTNVNLYNIDYFKQVSERNLDQRNLLAEKALAIIQRYRTEFKLWINDNDIHKLLSMVDCYTTNNLTDQANALIYKMDIRENSDKDRVKTYGVNLANHMLKDMVLSLKEMPKERSKEYAKMMEELLG